MHRGAGQGIPRQGPQALCSRPEEHRVPRSPHRAAPLPAPTPPWRREALPACPAFPGRAAWRRPPGRGGEERGGKGRMLRPPWGEAVAAAAGVAVLGGVEDATAVVSAAAGGGVGSDAVLRGGAVAAQCPHHAPADRSVTARLPPASGGGLPACAAMSPLLRLRVPSRRSRSPASPSGCGSLRAPFPLLRAPCQCGAGLSQHPPCRGSGGSRRTLHRRRRDGGLRSPPPERHSPSRHGGRGRARRGPR